MADEPRRSVRATKGQHTKKDDEMNTPEPPKKRSKKAIKKQEPEQEVEIIRCVCGATETQDNDEEPWIACDNCEAWQHNVCMGISTFDEDVPDSYLCEQCSPQSHQVLVNALQKGIKIWEDRRRAYEKSQEKEKPKKGGKKGKAKRTSDLKLEGNSGANGKAKSPASSARGSHPPPDKKEKKETPAKSSGTKRRRDESHETDSAKAAKIAKVTSAAPPPLPPTPTPAPPPPPPPQSPPSLVKITDLENQRQQVANYFLKFLQDSIPRAIKLSGLALKDGDTTESKAERLAVEIEDAVYKSHPNPMQRAKILALNLKRNLELTSGLLAKTLTPATLAIMSEDDLAPEELKRKNAELKAQNDKQSIMITDEGPRIRRTHKGEEILEVDDYVAPADDTTATSRRRSELDPNGEMAVRSRENSPGDGVELPDNIDEYRSQDNIRKNVTPKEPLKVNTKPTKPAVRKQSSTQDFDINKVFSSVQSPVGVQHARKPSIAGNAPPINGPGEDPEIDAMLEDDGNESPPYSPQEYNSDPEIVWRGSVRMDTVAQFPASAKHVGGNDLGPSPFSWSDILPKDVKVGGRISEETANEYLCGLRYSPNSDLVVVSITPSGETATQEFKKLFDYFQEKSKWGVVLAKSQGNVRDTYIVPVPPNPAMLPDFMENLESHKLSGDRSEEMILLAIVIRNQPEHLHNSIADGSSDPRSPSLMSHPQRQMSISGMGPSVSPIAPQGAFASPSQQQQQPQTPVPQRISRTPEELHRQQEQEERHRQQQEGEANARRILGPYIDAPTVHFLIPQAWQMRALEWEVIRDIFKSDPRAQQDLTHLSQLLEIREGGRGGS